MNDNIIDAVRLYDYLKGRSYILRDIYEVLGKLKKIESSINTEPEVLAGLLCAFGYNGEEDELNPREIIKSLIEYAELLQDCLGYTEEDRNV